MDCFWWRRSSASQDWPSGRCADYKCGARGPLPRLGVALPTGTRDDDAELFMPRVSSYRRLGRVRLCVQDRIRITEQVCHHAGLLRIFGVSHRHHDVLVGGSREHDPWPTGIGIGREDGLVETGGVGSQTTQTDAGTRVAELVSQSPFSNVLCPTGLETMRRWRPATPGSRPGAGLRPGVRRDCTGRRPFLD